MINAFLTRLNAQNGPPYIKSSIPVGINNINTEYQIPTWIYMRCGVSYITNQFFSYGETNGSQFPDPVINKTFSKEKFSASPIEIISDENLTSNYGVKNSSLDILFYNADNMGSQIYIKNLIILQDYVNSGIKFQY